MRLALIVLDHPSITDFPVLYQKKYLFGTTIQISSNTHLSRYAAHF